MRKHKRSCCLFSPIESSAHPSQILRFCRLGSQCVALKLTRPPILKQTRHLKHGNVASFLTGKARISTLPRHASSRRHFPRRKRRAPARSLTAHRFRPSHPRTHEPNQRSSASAGSDRPRVPPPRSSRPARLPFANRKKSLASRKPAPLLTRTARLGRRTTRTCSSSPADYGADTYTR